MKFKAQINEAAGSVTIFNDAEKLTLANADGTTASEAIKFASDLLSTKVLPEHISFNMFKVNFKASGGAELVKSGNGAISFDRSTYEDLISTIGTAINQCTDKLRIRGGARPGVSSYNPPDPII